MNIIISSPLKPDKKHIRGSDLSICRAQNAEHMQRFEYNLEFKVGMHLLKAFRYIRSIFINLYIDCYKILDSHAYKIMVNNHCLDR